jgi:hypothetical protein
LVAANLPRRISSKDALDVVGRGVARTAASRPLALIQGSLSSRRAARRSPLLAGLHRVADGTLAGIGLCMLALSGLTLHWQNHWGQSFHKLESAQLLEHRLQESAALLEQHYLSAVRKPGWLVPTSSEKLIYFPGPPALERSTAPVLPLGLNLNQVRLNVLNLAQFKITDLNLADLKFSALNPLTQKGDHLPVGY